MHCPQLGEINPKAPTPNVMGTDLLINHALQRNLQHVPAVAMFATGAPAE